MRHFTGKKRLLFVPLFLAGFAGIIYITMLLWNNLMPQIFQLSEITFWQSAGLLILAWLLFGFKGHYGSRNFHSRSHLHEKLKQMGPEERVEFLSRLKKHWPHKSDCLNNDEKQEK